MKLKSQIEKVFKYLGKRPYKKWYSIWKYFCLFFNFLLEHIKASLLFFLTSPKNLRSTSFGVNTRITLPTQMPVCIPGMLESWNILEQHSGTGCYQQSRYQHSEYLAVGLGPVQLSLGSNDMQPKRLGFALPGAYLFPWVSYCGNLWFHRLKSITLYKCYVICDFNTQKKTQYVTKQMQMLHFLNGKSSTCVRCWSLTVSHERGLLLTSLPMSNVSQLSYRNIQLLRTIGKILRAHA